MNFLRKEIERALAGDFSDLRLPPNVQLQRVRKVISSELTETQKRYLTMYLDGAEQVEIARVFGVKRSTVCRTLRRSFDRLRRFLRY